SGPLLSIARFDHVRGCFALWFCTRRRRIIHAPSTIKPHRRPLCDRWPAARGIPQRAKPGLRPNRGPRLGALTEIIDSADVRFWHLADIPMSASNVRFWG